MELVYSLKVNSEFFIIYATKNTTQKTIKLVDF